MKERIFERLKHSLQLLAMPPEIQLRLLPSFVCKADELALELITGATSFFTITEMNLASIRFLRRLRLKKGFIG
jgi:hypothetical protein